VLKPEMSPRHTATIGELALLRRAQPAAGYDLRAYSATGRWLRRLDMPVRRRNADLATLCQGQGGAEMRCASEPAVKCS